MHIFQIPAKEKTSSDWTIGVVDCSGSMEPNWSWLAKHWNDFIPLETSKIITFDTKAKMPDNNRLNEDIQVHGGGGTNITAGFVKLDQELMKLPQGSNITIVFISDGEDNNINTLNARMSELEGNDGTKRINFICIGVGSGFPTFISMKLREKYHNGDETLPAIFLIEHISEKAYTIKFEAIKPFLTVGQQRQVKPSVCVFPWREYSSNPFERAWVMTESDSIEIDGEKVDVKQHHLSFKGINELFRSWNQMINLESMKEGEKVDVRAKKTLAQMDSILEELKVSKGIDVFETAKDKKFDTFFQKFEFIINRRNFERIIWFYNDVKKIASGDTAGQLSDFEAAKRIGLGTIVGKAAQKAFALKNITPAEFQSIKDEFKELLKTHKVENKPGCALRKLLLENDLDKALNLITNQLELFDSFPLYGVPIRIVKNDLGQIDLQKLDIRYVAEGMTGDLSEIMKEEGGNLMITVKEGKQEAVNSVVPLFSAEDVDLLPFITSRLFRMQVSYNLTRDPENVVEQSLLLLLTGIFAACFRGQKVNEVVLNSVLSTFALIKPTLPPGDLLSSPATNDIIQLMKEKETEGKVHKSSNVKIMLNAIVHYKAGHITKETMRGLLKHLVTIKLYNGLSTNPKKIKDAYTYKLKDSAEGDNRETTIIKKITGDFARVKTLGELQRRVAHEILNQAVNAELDVEFVPSKIEKVLPDDTGFLIFTNFQKFLELEWFNDKEIEEMLLTAKTAKDEFDLHFEDKTRIEEAKTQIKLLIKEGIQEEVNKHQNHDPKFKGAKGKGKKPKKNDKAPTSFAKVSPTMKNDALYKACVSTLIPEFRKFFKEIHKEVLPETKEDIQAYCKTTGVNFKSITFSENSLLPTRTCAAKGCHFYMKDMKRLDNHLKVWGIKLPKGFHLIVKNNRGKTVDEIYEVLATTHFTEKDGKPVPFDPHSFEKTKEEVLTYIKNLQAAYNKILGH